MRLQTSFKRLASGDIRFWIYVRDREDFPSDKIFYAEEQNIVPERVHMFDGDCDFACGESPNSLEATLDVNRITKVIAEYLDGWRAIDVPTDFELVL